MLLCALIYPKTGGADRDRTGDPRVANAVLSQLSYSPVINCALSASVMVGLGGLEPPTSPLSGARSNHLSYRPNVSTTRRGLFVGLGYMQVSCVGTLGG
jgi:hypothetical protein